MPVLSGFCEAFEGYEGLNFVICLIPTLITLSTTSWSLYHLWHKKNENGKHIDVQIQIKCLTSIVFILFSLVTVMKIVSDITCFDEESDSAWGFRFRDQVVVLYGFSLVLMLFLFYYRLKSSFENTAFQLTKNTQIAFNFFTFCTFGMMCACTYFFLFGNVNMAIIMAFIWVALYLVVAICTLVLFVHKLDNIAGTVHESIKSDGSMGTKELQLFGVMSKYTIVIIFALISTLATMFFLIVVQVSNDKALFYGIDVMLKSWDASINSIFLSMQLPFSNQWFHCCCSRCNHWCKKWFIHNHLQHMGKMKILYKQSHQVVKSSSPGSASPV